ncbi:MAG: hypothetical protein P4M09_06905 [Devosia sp.]|nr:hypothetical protein [Devosia sp.]
MVNELLQGLRSHADDVRFGRLISQAIDFVSSSTVEREHPPTGSGQSSKSVADLHAFRKRSGYYAKASIQGLDETIDALRSTDALVWLGIIETNRGSVAIWRDEDGAPLGIMIFKTKVEVG